MTGMGSGRARARGTILVVEDEGLIRELLICAFEDAGFDVVDVGSGDEAMALLQGGGDAAAVVTDVRMPGRVDGLELARWLGVNRPGCSVFVTSGYVSDEQARTLGPSVAAVLGKPYRPEEVVALVAGQLGRPD